MEIGDLKINKHGDKYVWLDCAKCGKERWVRLVKGKPKSPCCRGCAEKKPFHHEVLYPPRDDKEAYILFYGKDLSSRLDKSNNSIYRKRIFCRDCPDFEVCMGTLWDHCPTRAEVLGVINEK